MSRDQLLQKAYLDHLIRMLCSQSIFGILEIRKPKVRITDKYNICNNICLYKFPLCNRLNTGDFMASFQCSKLEKIL